ncbi:MAG: glycosyltransferase family 39 protein [bacterium]
MNYTPLVIILLAFTILLPRVFNLDAFQTADEKMWIANTQGFTKNLATGRLGQLLQQAHPGITTQWLSALTINSSSLTTRKLPLVIGQSIIIGLIGYIFYRLWGRKQATILTLLLALNPFLVAHTRVYAMDSLLALFLLLSVGCLLLWQKNKVPRYLAFSAVAGALAVLSKLSGLLIIPFSLLVIFRPKPAALWLVVLILALVLVFPSLLLNFSEVIHLTQKFLLAGDARDTHHAGANYTYYLETLIFFSTPLHLAAIIAMIFLAVPRLSREARQGKVGTAPTIQINKNQLLILILFIALFTILMTLGAKKGDRYILPSFLLLDTLVVITFFYLINLFKTRRLLLVISYCLLVTGLLWQAIDITRLHPHLLAYVNPVTKPFYGDRRLGWGEGFDLAADYLNKKPNATELIVASVYPTEFAYNFIGQVIPLNHFEDNNADYVVLYRALFERGPDAWETDILNRFSNQTPEKTITLNGLDYIWIYKK